MFEELDACVLQGCPLVPVPTYCKLQPMTEPGQRILVSGSGVFVQLKLDWIDTVQRAGSIDPTLPLPYGHVEESLTLACGALPVALLEEFIAMARAALPDETAAVLIWSRARGVRLAPGIVLSASPDHVRYDFPPMADDEHMLMDLHSHARWPAGFSDDKDDQDDTGLRLAGVVGNLDCEVPSAAFRLCINGMFRSPALPWDRVALPWCSVPDPWNAARGRYTDSI